MTQWWFADNTVLCSFAHVDRLDILESVLARRGRWTAAVADEAARSVRAYQALSTIPIGGWLDDPIEISKPNERQRVNVIRTTMFGVAPTALSHLGEAETLFVIKEKPEFNESIWLSDDAEALSFAKKQGILIKQTMDILCIAVADSDITAQLAWDLMDRMQESNGSIDGRTFHRKPRSVRDFYQ